MKAILYINGVIGTIDNVRGIELSDVVSQIKQQGSFDELEVIIGYSEGGVVQVGFDIYNYLKSLNKPITTVIESYCASISSVIFLAGDKRIIKQNAKLMIHNPWGQPTGDAELLESYSAELRKIEKQITDIYNDKTSIGKETLSALMRNETEMTANEAVDLGFAHEVGEQIKAVAYFKFNKNDMSKKNLKEQLAGLLAKLNGNALGLTLQDSKGVELVFETEDEKPKVGDKATADGRKAEGSFIMPNGSTFIFEDGELKEIKEKVTNDLENDLENKIAEMVKNEVANAIKETQENVELVAKTIEQLSSNYAFLAKSVKSNFKTSNGQEQTDLTGVKDDVYAKYIKKEKEGK